MKEVHPNRRAAQNAEMTRLIAALARVNAEINGPSAATKDTNSTQTDNPRVSLARAMLAARRRITDFFPEELFADAARDLLLDLFIAYQTKKRVSVSSACIAAAVPSTTALRWIGRLNEAGLIATETGGPDRRMVFVRLTPTTVEQMERYLDQAALHLAGAL